MKRTLTSKMIQFLEEHHGPLRLACTSTSGWPVILSLWYLPSGEKLYCASTNSAKVISYLAKHPNCAFEVSTDNPPYVGVRGQGVASLKPQLGAAILRRLLERYLHGTTSKLARRLLQTEQLEVAIEITPRNCFTWDYTERMRNSI
jgi:uncharacterized pyridoxamine 5'-phosphate oxidase family protein